MRAIRFRLPAGEKEELLDALLPLLPAGVREIPRGDEVELVSVAAAPPSRAALEAAAGAALGDWEEHPVPADWRARRALLGGGILVGGRILVRSPDDPPGDAPGLVDLELERGGGGFGSGSHPTTRMCLELLLDLAEPSGGAADLGCGLGTLAIAAARLGWAPVAGVDRMAGAVEVAEANGRRNGVAVDWAVADLEADPVPVAALLLVNAPPSVQGRVASAAAAAGASVRAAIVSGMLLPELREALPAYAGAGLTPVRVLEDDGWVAARLERADA